tara:strand:+ start:684 stop:1262 length:579 start_codon:yes stop_codon:yes gene_type:complete
MKKLLLLLLICLPFLSYTQDSDRVLEIREMYKETKSYAKKGDCNTIRWLSNYPGIGEELDYGLERKVTRCIYPEGYSRISLNFNITECGGGLMVNAEYYYEGGYYVDLERLDDNLYRDGALYFAYITYTKRNGGKDQNHHPDVRLYFNSDGSIEKVLEDLGDGNAEIKRSIESIRENELKWLDTARKALRLW